MVYINARIQNHILSDFDVLPDLKHIQNEYEKCVVFLIMIQDTE